MTLLGALALFITLFALAALPGGSALIVTARTAASGLAHGTLAAAGIVAGDILYILVAVLGLSFLATTVGGYFDLVRYAAGAGLLWLGYRLWRAESRDFTAQRDARHSLLSSFTTGFLFTLADQKAVLFYLGLFPAFMNLDSLDAQDILLIIAVAVPGVGLPKLAYAWLAARSVRFLKPGLHTLFTRIAGVIIAATGAWLIITT